MRIPRLALACLVGTATLSLGCRQTIDASASILKTTIVTTGKLAGEGVKAAGSVAKAGLDGTARILSPSAVAIISESGKTVRRMPWEKGMTLYAAAKDAELDAAVKAIQLLRGRETFERSILDYRSGTADIPLRRGDRIRLVRR